MRVDSLALRRLGAAAVWVAAASGFFPGGAPTGTIESPPVAASNKSAQAPAPRVDSLLTSAWSAAGVTPAEKADDATFMRRAYLDLTGAVPTVAEARAFVADERPDRRARLVDRLLSSERYAEHWTNY